MEFPDPLIPGRLVKRYKRFLADVELAGGEVVVAHCANPGSMLGLTEPGSEVWLSPSRNPARKLKFSWELIEADGGLVGINTSHPNRLVEEAILAGAIEPLAGYGELRREVRYGKNSRIDILLHDEGRPDCYVEVKNVHLMRQPALAEFPDSVTKRGAKHLEELGDMVEAGARAIIFYLVQRTDCSRLAIAGDIDPGYGAAFERALGRGVEALCYSCMINANEIRVAAELSIDA
ncbi:MAG: DNA/RNA nuclease SfsA [Alphaproteobacteria bacterium]|jgi:sugar fermentation stimulation protein A|nr:DNA/RNA nuclease SfsA [Alphaproteobacteria bacterium]